MRLSIRTRLLLLTLVWALPALAVSAWLVHATAQTAREAHERGLRDTASALALAVDHELERRAATARMLARADALDRLPDFGPADRDRFDALVRGATAGLAGWVELRVGDRLVYDSRRAPAGTDSAPRPAAGAMPALHRGDDGRWFASWAEPVHPSAGPGVAGTVVVTLVAQELQALVDRQRVQADHVGVVIDRERRIAARHPGGDAYAGRPVTPDLKAQIDGAPSGFYTARTLDGVDMVGWWSTTAQGWTYVAGMPKARFDGFQREAAAEAATAGLLLLAAAALAALWVSQGIGRAVFALRDTAARMRHGDEVDPPATGVVECDEVGRALAQASRSARAARDELQRQVAEAVERTREAEQRASRGLRVEALGRLTGGVAHDFNNLLGVISNSAHLMQRQVARLPELQAPLAATLRAVEAGSRLTQTLVRFAGQRAMQPRTLSLARWLPENEELVRSVLGRRVRLEVVADPATPAVSVDAAELELALVNLVLNARDAMPDGGQLRIEVGTAQAGEVPAGDDPARWARLRVIDDGAGLASGVAERAFEPYVTSKPAGKGTGLGLSQVHGFCSQAGGRAALAPREGGGTVATVWLPAAGEAAPAPPAAVDAAMPSPMPRLDGLTVLLVDDNDALGDATAALLQHAGAFVRRATDPAAALASAAEQRPDVVLSDIVMPGPMDGIALAQALRARHATLPVVLITGYSQRLPEAAGFAVLRKPCSPADLAATLLRAVTPR